MKTNTDTKFKPGKSGNPTGRPKGTPNKSTAELKEVIKTILDSELGNVKKYLTQLEPKERLDFLVKILPYIIPKTSQIEHTAIIEQKKEPQPRIDYEKMSTEALEELERCIVYDEVDK